MNKAAPRIVTEDPEGTAADGSPDAGSERRAHLLQPDDSHDATIEARLDKPTVRELDAMLDAHEAFIAGRSGGGRASLAFKDLSHKDLSGRDLTAIDLTATRL
jgi:hypothetical protein